MKWHKLIPLFALAVLSSPADAETNLGRINIQLFGNIIDWTCVVVADDANKSVPLGSWATRDIPNKGDTTAPVAFQLRLTGCPTGPVSVTFQGVDDPSDTDLLSLNSSSTATKVAIQLMDKDKKYLPLNRASQTVQADENGNAVFNFYASYITTGSYPKAGTANADAMFLLNYD